MEIAQAMRPLPTSSDWYFKLQARMRDLQNEVRFECSCVWPLL